MARAIVPTVACNMSPEPVIPPPMEICALPYLPSIMPSDASPIMAAMKADDLVMPRPLAYSDIATITSSKPRSS